MIQQLSLKLPPQEAASNTAITQQAATALGIRTNAITGYHILKRSIDARSRQVYFILTLKVFVMNLFMNGELITPAYDVLPASARRC